MEDKKDYVIAKNLLAKIILIKGLKIIKVFPTLSSIMQGLSVKDWGIRKNKKNLLNYFYAGNAIKNQRNKLKLLVKTSKNQRISIFIKKLNEEIALWKHKYSITTYRKNVPKLLDLYINKLIWRFVKKEHPRRPNTWIYNKYWKNFFGYWRFTAINKDDGKIYVLSSHEIAAYTINKQNYPNLLNRYDPKNLRKMLYINFYLLKNSFSGVGNIIYFKQKGLCYKCQLVLNFEERKILTIKVQKRTRKKNFAFNEIIFIHKYCKN